MAYDKSEKVEVKKGIFRRIRVDVSGKAIWTVNTPDGPKYTAGDVVDGKYKPLPKYQSIIDNYQPKETDSRQISLSYHEKIRRTVLERRWRNQNERVVVDFDGHQRNMSWKGSIHGDLSNDGVYYYGVFEDDEFVIRSYSKYYENNATPFPVGTRVPAKMKKKRKK